MFKAVQLQKVQYVLLYLLPFAIPFPFIYVNIALFSLILVWLLQVNPKTVWRNLLDRKIYWIYILYFLTFALSYFYSDNKGQSSFDTGSKMFLVILPIVIGCGINIEKRHLQNILFAFVTGVTFIAISSLSSALIEWRTSGDVSKLFYHSLVKNLDANAVYEALYTFFAISLLLMYKWTKFFNGRKIIIKYLFIAVQLVFFVLLSARMLTLLAVVFLLPYYIIFIFRTRFNPRKIAITGGVIAILLSLVIFTNNPVQDRFEDIFNKKSELAFLDDYSNVKEEDFNTVTLRLFLWRMGIENINENKLWLTGCGNGDAQAMQNSKLKQYGIRNIHEELAERSPLYNINLHNMYLQTFIMVGITGLILLIIITLQPFFIYEKKLFFKIFIPFHVSAIFFMMQESMFQTQAGLAYYTYFSVIYYSYYYRYKNVIK